MDPNSAHLFTTHDNGSHNSDRMAYFTDGAGFVKIVLSKFNEHYWSIHIAGCNSLRQYIKWFVTARISIIRLSISSTTGILTCNVQLCNYKYSTKQIRKSNLIKQKDIALHMTNVNDGGNMWVSRNLNQQLLQHHEKDVFQDKVPQWTRLTSDIFMFGNVAATYSVKTFPTKHVGRFDIIQPKLELWFFHYFFYNQRLIPANIIHRW